MTRAIRIHEVGGPEVMRYQEAEPGRPGEGEVLIRQTAIGLNFIDVYYRAGHYKAPAMPFTPGNEAAGQVLEVGPGVASLKPGDRVAYAVGQVGAYAEQRVMPAERLVNIPDGVADEQAAAMMLKGMTAEYLLRRTFTVKSGDTILCHAAAGGVGLILGQWAKHIGARTIGTAGSPEKIALAQAHGYDFVVDYRKEDFVEKVRTFTGGTMCDVVYDSVGADTFPGSLDCLKRYGMFVTFGQSSGPIPPFNTAMLAQKGCLYMTRPTLFTYIAGRDELESSASALFDVVAKGVVDIRIDQKYPLAEAARAHADLEARKTTGATVLIP